MQEYYNINDVLDNLCRYLKDVYPEFKVYDHDPQQGLKVPCFIVKTVNESFKKRIGLESSSGVHGTDNVMFSIHIIVEDGDWRTLREVTQQIRVGLTMIPNEYGGYRTYAMNNNYSEFESTLLFRIKVFTFQDTAILPRMNGFEIEQGVEDY